jgi:hypothetical protein
MEATFTSETLVDFQLTTCFYISEDRTLHNNRCENLCKVQCVTLRYKSWCTLVSYDNCITLRYLVDLSWHAVQGRTPHSASLHMAVYCLGQCTHHVSSRRKQRHQHFNTAPDRAAAICIIFPFCFSLLHCVSPLFSHKSPHPGLPSSPGASPPASTGR